MRKTRKRSEHYVNNKEFLAAIIAYKDQIALAEARGRHLRESTAAFAGKLHGEVVTHFDRLVATVESGSLSSLDYLLGQIRSSVAAARYKRAHSSVLGLNEIQDAYARCIPACESYLRVLNQVELKDSILDRKIIHEYSIQILPNEG